MVASLPVKANEWTAPSAVFIADISVEASPTFSAFVTDLHGGLKTDRAASKDRSGENGDLGGASSKSEDVVFAVVVIVVVVRLS